jgi:hypothetical protein
MDIFAFAKLGEPPRVVNDAKEITLSPDQRDCARRALGLGLWQQRGGPATQRKQSYRNRITAFVRSDIWDSMVDAGLATRSEMRNLPDAYIYRLTRAGALAALDAGESLCPEDFPPLKDDDVEKAVASATKYIDGGFK